MVSFYVKVLFFCSASFFCSKCPSDCILSNFLQECAACLLLLVMPVHGVPGWPEVEAHATLLAVRAELPSGRRIIGRLFSPTLRLGQKRAPAVLLLRGVPGVEDCGDVAYALRDAGIHCLDLQHSGCWASAGIAPTEPEGDKPTGISLDSVRLDAAAALRCPPRRGSPFAPVAHMTRRAWQLARGARRRGGGPPAGGGPWSRRLPGASNGARGRRCRRRRFGGGGAAGECFAVHHLWRCGAVPARPGRRRRPPGGPRGAGGSGRGGPVERR